MSVLISTLLSVLEKFATKFFFSQTVKNTAYKCRQICQERGHLADVNDSLTICEVFKKEQRLITNNTKQEIFENMVL